MKLKVALAAAFAFVLSLSPVLAHAAQQTPHTHGSVTMHDRAPRPHTHEAPAHH